MFTSAAPRRGENTFLFGRRELQINEKTIFSPLEVTFLPPCGV
jgi:hypothetical protein